jgi:hypothetical protein
LCSLSCMPRLKNSHGFPSRSPVDTNQYYCHLSLTRLIGAKNATIVRISPSLSRSMIRRGSGFVPAFGDATEDQRCQAESLTNKQAEAEYRRMLLRKTEGRQ